MTALRAAVVTPLSGPLATYGLAGAAALAVWAGRAAELPARWTRVELDVLDAYPKAAAAMRAAVSRRPDVIFGPYGSGPAVAALGATDELVWNHGGATDRLNRPRFDHALNVPAPASAYFSAVLEAVRASAATASAVVMLHVSTGFGREVARGALEAARRIGFEIQAHEFAAVRAGERWRRRKAGYGSRALHRPFDRGGARWLSRCCVGTEARRDVPARASFLARTKPSAGGL